jgi:hypothetical protein
VGCLNSLSEFLDTMGSAMAALGLFSQVGISSWQQQQQHVKVEGGRGYALECHW